MLLKQKMKKDARDNLMDGIYEYNKKYFIRSRASPKGRGHDG